MIELANVTKQYPDGADHVVALDDVTLTVARGELVVAMGPSASGKSTLIQVCAGVVAPTSGTVSIDGRVLSTMRPRERAKLRRTAIGVVFQDDELDPVLSASQNVALPLRLSHVSPSAAARSAAAALERCGVGAIGSRRPDALSGGQRQRVALARAIVGDRAVLLADEPTASLDTAAARSVVELLVELAAAGLAVLMTTHDSRLASFADRVVFLRDGKLVEVAAAGTGSEEQG